MTQCIFNAIIPASKPQSGTEKDEETQKNEKEIDPNNVYSGVENFKLSAGTCFTVSGVSYTLKADKVVTTENATKNLIALIKADCNVVELKYRLVCSGCKHTLDLTVQEIAEHKEAWGVTNVNGYDLPLLTCSNCNHGGYVLSNP